MVSQYAVRSLHINLSGSGYWGGAQCSASTSQLLLGLRLHCTKQRLSNGHTFIPCVRQDVLMM